MTVDKLSSFRIDHRLAGGSTFYMADSGSELFRTMSRFMASNWVPQAADGSQIIVLKMTVMADCQLGMARQYEPSNNPRGSSSEPVTAVHSGGCEQRCDQSTDRNGCWNSHGIR